MSTYDAVTRGENAVQAQSGLGPALWAWTVATLLIGVLSWLNGGEIRAVSSATALALAPAFAGFILLPRLGENTAALALVGAWLLTGIGLAAGCGGASPIAATLLVAPAIAHAMGYRRVPEIAAAAVLGYAAAVVLAHFYGRESVGPFPELLAVVSIAMAGGLIAHTAQEARALAPATRETAMGQRVAEISHDLRTPLTHILGFSEILEKELFGPIGPRNVEYAGLIRQSGTHLLDIVNDLLDLSKIEAGRYEIEFERFDARAIIDEVLRLSVDAAEKKNIALSSNERESALPVNADPRAMRRMLMNTVGNAIKFTPEGGRVTIEARAAGERLLLDTLDTGPGIPEAERARLGNPYERGESGMRAEGTGLGLALVRELAKLHGGSLSFHDAPGGGALVRIEMPVVVSA